MKMFDRKYLYLLREIAVARYKLKDQSTFLGFAWSFLNPLIMLSLLFTLFSARLSKGIDHYAIFLLIGLVQYNHFSSSTNRSMHVLLAMRSLTADAIFPKELLVIGSAIADVVELFAAMGVCVAIARISGVDLSWPVLVLPFVFLLQLTLVLWVSYSPSFLERGAAQYIVWLNPLAHVVSFSRSLILSGDFFPVRQLIVFLVVNLLLLYGCLKLFRKCEPLFAEYL